MIFDADESKDLAASFAHRGQLPLDMGSRWDAQGAFIAGQRMMFERLSEEILELREQLAEVARAYSETSELRAAFQIDLAKAQYAVRAVQLFAKKCEEADQWIIGEFEMRLIREAIPGEKP